ncbi:MAG: hypothetical protein LBT48_05330 [Prevotellaceae bacterium]|jgi:hypothetical protein|nr:hypothetical protein [Prevotellaceae bacterium]
MENNKPNLFIIDDITNSYNRFLLELDSVISLINKDSGQIQLKSYYMYGYAIFENTLLDTYKQILTSFPERIKSEAPIINFSNKLNEFSLLGAVIEEIVADFSMGLTYGNIDKVFNRLGIALDISQKSISKSNLSDAKKLRNNITHDRTIDEIVTVEILNKHLINLKKILQELQNQIECKYKDYTKDKLRKDAWKWVMGTSSLLVYEEHWKLDNNGNMICYNFDYLEKTVGILSSSEKHILMLYLVNYSTLNEKQFSIKQLLPTVSINNKNRIAFITELFNKYPLLLQ